MVLTGPSDAFSLLGFGPPNVQLMREGAQSAVNLLREGGAFTSDDLPLSALACRRAVPAAVAHGAACCCDFCDWQPPQKRARHYMNADDIECAIVNVLESDVIVPLGPFLDRRDLTRVSRVSTWTHAKLAHVRHVAIAPISMFGSIMRGQATVAGETFTLCVLCDTRNWQMSNCLCGNSVTFKMQPAKTLGCILCTYLGFDEMVPLFQATAQMRLFFLSNLEELLHGPCTRPNGVVRGSLYMYRLHCRFYRRAKREADARILQWLEDALEAETLHFGPPTPLDFWGLAPNEPIMHV